MKQRPSPKVRPSLSTHSVFRDFRDPRNLTDPRDLRPQQPWVLGARDPVKCEVISQATVSCSLPRKGTQRRAEGQSFCCFSIRATFHTSIYLRVLISIYFHTSISSYLYVFVFLYEFSYIYIFVFLQIHIFISLYLYTFLFISL